MSTSDSMAFVPDDTGRALQFQKSGDATPVWTQVVISKGGGDLNAASVVTLTTAALAPASAEVLVAENSKRTKVYVYNTDASEVLRIIGAVSETGGYYLAPQTGFWFEGGGALYAYASDGALSGTVDVHLFENKIGA